jgi:hypothetical protein
VGDSGFAAQISLLVILLIGASIVAFVVAWRIRSRVVLGFVGVLLLALAAGCSLFSALATLLVAALGVAALVLAARTPRAGARGGKD